MEFTGQMCYNLGDNNNSVLATALTAPGREAGISGLPGIVPISPLSGYSTARSLYKMDDLIFQGELFSPDSEFHSDNTKAKGLVEKATKVKKRGRHSGRSFLDMAGQRFGGLVVIYRSGERFYNEWVWVCKCDCGQEVLATRTHLTRGKSPVNHCGCGGYGKYNISKPGARGIKGPERVANKPVVAFRTLYSNYRNSAARRGYEWFLSKQDFAVLTKGVCFYCGEYPSQVYRQRPHEYTYNGIDRLDSNKPYTPDNCVPCCGECNIAKGSRSAGDFLDWIERVYKHQQNGV